MLQKRWVRNLRLASEIFALLLFLVLLWKHQIRLWIVIFGISAILSVFFGRFYCSWICPMNTAFKGIAVIYRKLGINRIGTPKVFRNELVRYVILVLFVGAMIAVQKFGIKLSPLPLIVLFSILLTMVFDEVFWHRHLCPFGTILKLSSGKAFQRMRIDEAACIECGKCQKVCPTSSIQTLENGKRRNNKAECLLCGNCIDVCPVDACRFTCSRSTV